MKYHTNTFFLDMYTVATWMAQFALWPVLLGPISLRKLLWHCGHLISANIAYIAEMRYLIVSTCNTQHA
jgi:hypothetical protein